MIEDHVEVVGWQFDLLYNKPVALVSVPEERTECLSPVGVTAILGGDHRVFVAGYIQAVSDMYYKAVDIERLQTRLDELLE